MVVSGQVVRRGYPCFPTTTTLSERQSYTHLERLLCDNINDSTTTESIHTMYRYMYNLIKVISIVQQ